MISKNNVNTVSCDGVSVAIFLYNKTIILDLAFLVSAKINKVLVSVISLDLRFGWWHLARPWLVRISHKPSNNCLKLTNSPKIIHFYRFRVTLKPIWTTWLSFPFNCRWLEITSTQKWVVFNPVLSIRIVLGSFYLLILFFLFFF